MEIPEKRKLLIYVLVDTMRLVAKHKPILSLQEKQQQQSKENWNIEKNAAQRDNHKWSKLFWFSIIIFLFFFLVRLLVL